jgi:hypothetical protein
MGLIGSDVFCAHAHTLMDSAITAATTEILRCNELAELVILDSLMYKK